MAEKKSIEDQTSGRIQLTVVDRESQSPLEVQVKLTTEQGIVINPVSLEDRKYDFELPDQASTLYHLEIAVDPPIAKVEDPGLLVVNPSPSSSSGLERALGNPENPIPTTPTPPADDRSRIIVMVYHAFNSALPKSFDNLDYVSILLRKRPELTLEIKSHTDNVGNPEYNKGLSEARAANVRNYILKRGIDKARIQSAGSGDSEPLAANDSREGRRLNRRTEVSLIDPTY